MRDLCLMMAAMLAPGLAAAQEAPPAPDLTVPPAWRSGATATASPSPARAAARKTRVTHAPAPNRVGMAGTPAPPPGPVHEGVNAPPQLGIHVHGSGNDPRFFTYAGSAASQETGSGVTAGLRFGF